MLYLDALSEADKKAWVKRVISNVMELHGVANRNDLDTIYKFPVGTTNTVVSNGSYKRAFDLAITTSLHFNVSLDEILLNRKRTNELPDWKPLIANGVFKSLEAGVISVDYPNIEVAAEIILNEVINAEQPESLQAS
ncbi:hypothetical protein [Pseudoalteromonas phage KB12-38]|nr:hypothetical protein [Pseudoalteromonas phage KB12-38]